MFNKKSKLLFLACLLLLSCRLFEDDPPDKPTDPREYTWTLDTLDFPEILQLLMEDMWASSAEDIYLAGHSSNAEGKMIHFDGTSWESAKLHYAEGGPFYNLSSIRSVYGFSSSEIFAAGSKYGPRPISSDSSLIIHYDGTQWSEFDVSGFGGRTLQSIWGLSPNDVWAGGRYGSLFHFDGISWESIAMPDSIWTRSFAGFAYDDVYALAYSFTTGRFINYLFHWDGSNWTLDDQFTDGIDTDKFGSIKLEIIDGELYSSGRGVYKLDPSTIEWTHILNQVPAMWGLCGDRWDNIYAVGVGGAVYHYNGEDWHYFDELTNFSINYSDCWTDGREVFVVGWSFSDKSFILHGE